MNPLIFGISAITGLIVELFERHTTAQKIVRVGEIGANSLLFALVVPAEYNTWGIILIVGPALLRMVGMRATVGVDRKLSEIVGRMYLEGYEDITLRTLLEFIWKGYISDQKRERSERNRVSDERAPGERI